jgi:hypothetical protein
LLLLSISYFYLGGNNLVTSVASRDMLPRDAALADLPKVSTVYPVNAGDDIGSSIDEYIEDNPEVVLPIAIGSGVSTAGVALTIAALGAAVILYLFYVLISASYLNDLNLNRFLFCYFYIIHNHFLFFFFNSLFPFLVKNFF